MVVQYHPADGRTDPAVADSRDNMTDNDPNGLKQSLTSVRRVRVYEEIAQQIRTLIESGRLKPGHRLPPERELSEIFNVSRHSVREAFRVLEKSRMIKSVPGSGTYVTGGDHEVTLELIATYLLDKTDKLAEIFELRRIIEPQVARLAARNIGPRDREVLTRLLRENQAVIQAGGGDRREFVRLDHDLHQAIAQATRNSLIPKILERMNDIFIETRQEDYQSDLRMITSAQGHHEIVQAIIQGRAGQAAAAMEKHLRDVEQAIARHLVAESGKEPPDETGDV